MKYRKVGSKHYVEIIAPYVHLDLFQEEGFSIGSLLIYSITLIKIRTVIIVDTKKAFDKIRHLFLINAQHNRNWWAVS